MRPAKQNKATRKGKLINVDPQIKKWRALNKANGYTKRAKAALEEAKASQSDDNKPLILNPFAVE
jgi:hypothetical protein